MCESTQEHSTEVTDAVWSWGLKASTHGPQQSRPPGENDHLGMTAGGATDSARRSRRQSTGWGPAYLEGPVRPPSPQPGRNRVQCDQMTQLFKRIQKLTFYMKYSHSNFKNTVLANLEQNKQMREVLSQR